MKKRLLSSILLFGSLFLTGCQGIEIPEEKQDYIGAWETHGVKLDIYEGGRVDYEDNTGKIKLSFSGPITSFEGDSFRSKAIFVEKLFTVTKPPFKNESGQWEMKVEGHTLHKPMERGHLSEPSKAEQKALVAATAGYFNSSILAGSMEILYGQGSEAFQKDYTVASLEEAFTSFFEAQEAYQSFVAQGDFSFENVVLSHQPIFQPKEGVLALKGYFETEPRLQFEIMYVYENQTWKILALSFSV